MMRLSSRIRSTKAKLTMAALSVCTLLISSFNAGYAMQPPPPPLNLEQLEALVSSADVIAVGNVTQVKETENPVGAETKKTVQAGLEIEKLLKGQVAGKDLLIEETYRVFKPFPAEGAGKPGGMVVGLRAGPSPYHGEYSPGARIIVLLEKIEGSDGYRPLGSGSYDKHLCEFLVEPDGIETLNHFKFAEDLKDFAGSEDQFTDLIGRLRNSALGRESDG